MYHTQETVCQMILDLSNKHKGQIHSLVLDWEIPEINTPRHGKIQVPLPLLVIDFK